MSSDLLSSLNKNGSGLNLRDLTRTLVAAETSPRLSALQKKVDSETVKLSALGQVRGQFAALTATLSDIARNPVLTVTTSTGSIMPKVTDRNKLVGGAVPIEVKALATRHVLEFGGFSSGQQVLEAGRLVVERGRWDTQTSSVFTADEGRQPAVIDIEPGTRLDDLAGMLSKVYGITARVLNKGDGTFSLGIVGELGAANGLRLTASQGDGSGTASLSVLDTTATNAERQVQGAGDARMIVDGIAISRPTNTLKDVLPGMEITLSGTVSGSLTVERDASVAQSGVEKLVAGLNDTIGLLRSLTQRGVGGGIAGELAGDRNIEALEQSLRSLIATPLIGHGDRPVSLVDLGVATQKDGRFRFDPPAFDRTFAARASDFDALLGDNLRSLTDGARVTGVPDRSMASGDYPFKVNGDGSATLGGFQMLGLDLGGGARTFVATSGPVRGLALTIDPGVTSGTVRFGRSLVGAMAQMLSEASGTTGSIGRRETEIGSATTANQQRIEALEAKAAVLEKRYLTKFAAMEQAITRMNSTGGYIQNLVDMWSKD
jgi:flagellar hook-associated protein 2